MDIVQDYSAEVVLESLKKFAATRGWPSKISSDPGSQLEAAGGHIEVWWKNLELPLKVFTGNKGF